MKLQIKYCIPAMMIFFCLGVPLGSLLAESWMDTRKEMVDELKAEQESVKEASGEDVDISKAESVCMDEKDTISACRKEVRRARKELEKKKKGEDVVISVNGGQFNNVTKKGTDPRLGKR